MKAIVQDRYGSYDVLKLMDVPKPTPAGNEVLVRVHAAAINAYDWHVMRGDPYVMRLLSPAWFGLSGPKRRIRGRDFAGRVEAVGKAVTQVQPGDEVYGDLSDANGAFAEYVCVPVDLVDSKPANLTFEQAAAVPLAGTTALAGLQGVQPEQHVLINGASGGVGTFAVQIAKSLGAYVTGVCSKRNIDLVQSLGADHVIDYTQEDFTRAGQRYDLVFDLVGNHSLARLRSALTSTGTLVLSGGGVFDGGSFFGPMSLIIRSQIVSRFIRHRVLVLSVTPGQEHLAALRNLIESGKVVPAIDRTFPLHKVPDAIRYMEEEHAQAKVVITV
ncbi:NAD(P)-dependent alcohol dehydrogenase [Kibdelosporangium aridum]|uniref:NAD(P)-dependent alcohol dehydrogenase n=1 Tax=Kibdelosporangium aridum TaxID=2030 RepID=A0A428ZTZ0_KIBAR|nr:NAD(P)-dependent alcohol dehydrogenase [Kibdelosporangium aridum]RSM91554.1 NAD(P)-dependent alcohol dehydrogenase [Kibdelosporangium aridum]